MFQKLTPAPGMTFEYTKFINFTHITKNTVIKNGHGAGARRIRSPATFY